MLGWIRIGLQNSICMAILGLLRLIRSRRMRCFSLDSVMNVK